MHRHIKYTLIILDEENFLHPRCKHCGIFVPRLTSQNSHPNKEICKRGADRKRQRLATEESRRATDQVIMAQKVPLYTVHVFKYFDRLFPNNDDDWPTVHADIFKYPNIWERISWILARDGMSPTVSGMFYKA